MDQTELDLERYPHAPLCWCKECELETAAADRQRRFPPPEWRAAMEAQFDQEKASYEK